MTRRVTMHDTNITDQLADSMAESGLTPAEIEELGGAEAGSRMHPAMQHHTGQHTVHRVPP